MSNATPVNLPASVRARLKNKAQELGLAFDQVLQYYAMERFLFRLSKTEWADVLILKGAMMLRIWDGALARPTRDIDFLGRLDSAPESITAMVRDCLAVNAQDGIEYSTELSVEPISVEGRYPGARVVVRGSLSGARITLQLDIGVADTVVPEPGWVDYPTLLDMDSPRILVYQPATAVAEKFQAMMEKGLLNSRMKDYFDIWMLSRVLSFDGGELANAIKATFHARATPVPRDTPAVLTTAYSQQQTALAQWNAFKNRMARAGVETPGDLTVVCEAISSFIMPAAVAAAEGEPFALVWSPGRGWTG